MALTKINNNTLSAVTTLPAAIATGKVLQVVSVSTTTQSASSSSTYADVTSLVAAITPSAASSKIYIDVAITGVGKEVNDTFVMLKMLRDDDLLFHIDNLAGLDGASGTNYIGTVTSNFLDSPSSTSSLTYKVQLASGFNTSYAYVNRPNSGSPTSTITLMEIGA
jgi:hypothetical protein